MTRNTNRAARTRDNSGRDRTNQGTPTAWTRTRTRGKGQWTRRATTTKGKPDTQDDLRIPLHRCEPLLAGWIADGRRRTGAQQRAHAPAAANDCSQGRKRVIMDDQKYGA